MPMTIVAHADHPAIGGVQGGEQGRCPMPFIVVGHSSAAALLQGQARLRAVQGLNLAFLIHAQHHSMFGRIEIKPHDGLQFFRKLRVITDFEGPCQVRLQPVGVPDATNRRLTHAGGRGHGAGAPMSSGRRRQRATFSSVIPNSLAITLFCPPSAARRMIRARSTWRAGSNLARACCSNMERCSVLKVTGGAMRILALHCEGRAREYNRHYLWRTTLGL